MKKFTYILVAALITFTAGCSDDSLHESEGAQVNKVVVPQFDDGAVLPGQLAVKLAQEPLGDIQIIKTRSGATELTTGLKAFDAKANLMGVKKMERIFPPAGRFEKRSREAGLHLWYTVEFDESVLVSRAAADFAATGDVEIVEPVVEVQRIGNGEFVLAEATVAAAKLANSNFNDPRLGEQWHYNNDGTVLPKAVAGADARIFSAWELETGKPEVIVAVVDGGIDITHEDIVDNLWVNQAEMGGSEGVDDDGNGYADDIHGYNFTRIGVHRGKLVAHTHGTHVAGTIAARNNNGIGVSGVAGGDGTPGSGVRLMSCQIFDEDRTGEYGATTTNTAAALKYGADNGAVISQNSWGYPAGGGVSPAVLNLAIKYFMDNAGIDENGNQEGPMRGGLVVFASGNDNSRLLCYPAAVEGVVSVNATGPDYKRAIYSNYGTWTKISAPGGDQYIHGERGGVLSTVAGWDGDQRRQLVNEYAFYHGTSMACPHVSGVAALLVSYYGVGSKGLTPDDIKEMIYSTAYDLDAYNPSYAGMMGAGGIDAGAALRYGFARNNPPVVDQKINDYMIEGTGKVNTIVLGNHFSDPDQGDVLTYSVECANPSIVTATINDGVLSFTPIKYGSSRVTVTATDQGGMSVSTYFRVICTMRGGINEPINDDRKPGEIVPRPNV